MITKFVNRIERIQKTNLKILRLKQESFNVFSILRKETEEEKLHSAFIAELLNVKGNHNLGDKLLAIFINKIIGVDFKIDNSIIVKTEKQLKNGRADIYIKNNRKEVVLIENKIYAGDQEKQLIRYSNHKNSSEVSKLYLIYLTLNGKDADEISTKSKSNELISGKDYFTISYRDDILDWLEMCLKESVNHPTLRETIKQYINLVKKITGQLTDDYMENEIYSEIKNNFKTAKLIADNIWKVQEMEVQLFIEELGEYIENKLGSNWEITVDKVNKKWGGISVRSKDWSPNTWVKFEGQSKIATTSSIYGIHAYRNLYDRKEINERLANIEILKTGNFRESDYWPFCKTIINFGKSSEIEKLFVTKERKILLEQLGKLMIDLSKECEPKLKELIKIKPA